ncbi:hypothetical protein [Oleiagrimonas citrea]
MPHPSPLHVLFRNVMQNVLRAYLPLRKHGELLDPASHLPFAEASSDRLADTLHARAPLRAQDIPITPFLVRLHALQNAKDESARRRSEQALLTLAASLKNAGVFELIHIAHPAIAAMVRDHLDDLGKSGVTRRDEHDAPSANTAFRSSESSVGTSPARSTERTRSNNQTAPDAAAYGCS